MAGQCAARDQKRQCVAQIELEIDAETIVSTVEVIESFAHDIFELIDRAMKDESGIHII